MGQWRVGCCYGLYMCSSYTSVLTGFSSISPSESSSMLLRSVSVLWLDGESDGTLLDDVWLCGPFIWIEGKSWSDERLWLILPEREDPLIELSLLPLLFMFDGRLSPGQVAYWLHKESLINWDLRETPSLTLSLISSHTMYTYSLFSLPLQRG